MTEEEKLEVGLFRYGLIHPLLQEGLQKGEKAAIMRQILSREYKIPLSSRTKISERTLFTYLKWYSKGSFSALMPEERKDAGSVRGIPEEVLKKAEVRNPWVKPCHRSREPVENEGEHPCHDRLITSFDTAFFQVGTGFYDYILAVVDGIRVAQVFEYILTFSHIAYDQVNNLCCDGTVFYDKGRENTYIVSLAIFIVPEHFLYPNPFY